MKKVVLAYSGGLDTSVILKWLALEKGFEVIAACIDVGQKDDFEKVASKALTVGAKEVYVVDAKEEFIDKFVMKGIQAGAVYEQDYLLGTAYARPLIAEKLVAIANEVGAIAIAHGATGKGNDQVRFEAGIKALDPSLEIIAPWREWTLKSREDCIDYAKKHQIPVESTKEKIYSRDENLFHISHEGGELENPWEQHSDKVYTWVTPLAHTPDVPEQVEITYEKGLPVAVNGIVMSALEIVELLNAKGSHHHIGIADIVENRLIGMKSRGVYETPAGTILLESHKALEKLVHDRKTMKTKMILSNIYAELIYDGLWHLPVKASIDAFIEHTQSAVTGKIVVSLYKGKATVVASSSPHSLYHEEYVTFGEDDVYTQKDAEGFINLFTLPLKLSGMLQKDVFKKDECSLNCMVYKGGTHESMAGTF